MKFLITHDAERRLQSFIKALDVEIGGLGYATRKHDDQGNLVVVWDEVFLVPQTVSSAEVEFEGEALMFGIERAALDRRLDDPNFVWVSWHSHHTMKAFWSGTDETCIRTYGDMGARQLLSYVGCHNGEYKMRFDHFGVEHDGVFIGQVTQSDLMLEHEKVDDPLLDAIHAEISANVSKAKPVVKKLPQFGQSTFKPQPKSKPGKKLEKAFDVADGAYFNMDMYEADILDLIDAGMSRHDAEELAIEFQNDSGPGYRDVHDGFSQQVWEHYGSEIA